MLLLVVAAELDQAERVLVEPPRAQRVFDALLDDLAVPGDLGDARPGDQAPPGTGLPVADHGFGVERTFLHVAQALSGIAAPVWYRGVTGDLQFRADSRDPVKSAVILQIREGRFHYFTNASP